MEIADVSTGNEIGKYLQILLEVTLGHSYGLGISTTFRTSGKNHKDYRKPNAILTHSMR